MKKLLSTILVMVMLAGMILPCVQLPVSADTVANYQTTDFSGLRLSVIGDSISTFYGVTNSSTYNPLYLSTSEATFGTYYGNTSHEDYADFSDITRADTWWQQTVDTLGMELLVNNAWSGSYVLIDSAQSNSTEYPAAAYKTRSVNLHNGSKKPDIIAVYLGTNDIANYNSQDVGTKADVDTASERSALYTSVNNYATPSSSIEAYYIMISRMVATYGDAEIYCMLPTITMNNMSSGRANALNNFNEGVKYIVNYFNGLGKKVYLVDLNADSGLTDNVNVRNYYYCNNVHPSAEGMDMITNCLISEIMENSQKGLGNDTLHEVTYELDNAFPAEGLTRYAVDGQPLDVAFKTYEAYQNVDFTITMGGKDITSYCYDGSTVKIPKVTGPVTIKATGDTKAHYSWKGTSSGLISDHGYGYQYNAPTLVSGTYTGSATSGSFSSCQYSLQETVVLQYNKPWEMEFQVGGTFAGGILMTSDTSDGSVSGNTYIHINQTGVLLGYRDSVGYNNSGVQWTTIASALGSSAGADIRSETHTYRFVNEPNGTTNKVYLFVDGVKIGDMNTFRMIGNSPTHDSASAVNISGKNFVFNYLGSEAHPLQNFSMSYMKIWENGEPDNTKNTFSNYRWELSSDKNSFVNISGNGFSSNDLIEIAGTLSDGVSTSRTYGLEKEIILQHDRLWSIEWKIEGNWSGGGMVLSNTRQSATKNNVYLFRSSAITMGASIGSQYNLYGITPSDYGINRADLHTYKLVNKVNEDGSNMVYLYVDGVELGSMTNYYVNGTAQGTTSDWICGQDFAFNYIGTERHPVNDVTLYYLQVSEGCMHDNMTWTTVQNATCTTEGTKSGTCTVCGETSTAPIPAIGHDYSCTVQDATCTSYAVYTFTCSRCGDSYQMDAGEMANSWIEQIPTGMDPALFDSKTEYRYSDYETQTSYETALDGFTLKSSVWEQSGSGSVSYVINWPSGFLTSHSLYSQYNKLSSKVTAGETATTKTTVNSDSHTGYLYYHWCYSGDYISYPSETGNFTTFHAYFSTTPPTDYKYDASDGSYRAVWSGCSNSNWFWPIDVYTQTYTTYNKLNTFERWTDFSDWSETPVTASDVRRVESRTVYQLKDASMAGHSYNSGTVTKAPTCTATGVRTYQCLECGDTYTESIPRLTHSYTAEVTAPTCDSKGYTTYTCTTCGNSYLDDVTEATGHSYKSVVTEPTCQSGGYTTYTCTVCNDSYIADETSPSGHSYKSTVTEPTCTTDGYTTHTCTVCGTSYVDSVVMADGHKYQSVVTAPTCTTKGYTTYTCSCGDSFISDEVNALGHSYKTVTVNPTCTAAGSVTKTCANCGDVVTQTLSATGHSYVDGYCSSCGAKDPNYSEIVIPTISLKYPTLAFEDEILYNLYFNVDDMTSVVEMGLVTFATRNENGTVADALETIPGYVKNNDGSYTAHSNGVPAKMLGDALYFKAYAKLSDGSYVYSGIAGYHAVLYANTVLNSDATSANAKSLVVAMLNYGAAAQVDFDYKTDSLMNAGLTEAHQALVEDYSESMVAAVPSVSATKAGSFVNNGGYSDLHPTVSFEGAFSINYYFTPKYTPANGTITFYYWNLSDFNANSTLKATNATGSVEMTSTDGVYTAAVEGIAAKAIDEPVFIAAVYTNGGTSYYTPVIGYSLGAYCKNLASNGNAFGAATAVYGFYAKAYFAS